MKSLLWPTLQCTASSGSTTPATSPVSSTPSVREINQLIKLEVPMENKKEGIDDYFFFQMEGLLVTGLVVTMRVTITGVEHSERSRCVAALSTKPASIPSFSAVHFYKQRKNIVTLTKLQRVYYQLSLDAIAYPEKLAYSGVANRLYRSSSRQSAEPNAVVSLVFSL